jgi:hypothetical protein
LLACDTSIFDTPSPLGAGASANASPKKLLLDRLVNRGAHRHCKDEIGGGVKVWQETKESLPVIVSDTEAIQTKPQLQTPSLDRFALLAMTDRASNPDDP